MELRHLRYFIAVAEEENVTRAASRLHVSQPALSRQVRDLEEELGVQLFERSAKAVHLTPAGKVFLEEARAVMHRAAEAVQAARNAAVSGRGELLVGYAPSLTVRILPPTLRAFQLRLPQVRVALNDLSTGEMLTQLREGKLQIAFLVRPSRGMLRGLRFEDLTQDRMCLAVAPKHPFARRKSVPLAEVVREPIIGYSRRDYPEYHEFLAELFAPTKTKHHLAEEHDGVTSLIAAVEAGGGVALVPESVICLTGPRVKLLALTPVPAPLIIGAAWLASGLTPQAEQFLECARAAAKPKS